MPFIQKMYADSNYVYGSTKICLHDSPSNYKNEGICNVLLGDVDS